MPVLKMYIGDIYVDRHDLDYTGFETVVEREQYNQRIAEYMYWLHIEKHSWRIKQLPLFFVEVESKMNDRTFTVENEELFEVI